MSVRPILVWPDPRLSTPCRPIETITPQDERLAQDLLDTMYDANGRGIAAPQVGELRRMFAMDITWKAGKPEPRVLINPELIEASEERASLAEGCLSIPGILTEISRPKRVKIAWTNLAGTRLTQTFDGFAAVCIQHEMDHLDGVVTFDRLEPAARAKALKEYEVLS